jgi:hypothetical protein
VSSGRSSLHHRVFGRRRHEVHKGHCDAPHGPSEQHRPVAAPLCRPPERQRTEGCPDNRDHERKAADFPQVGPPEVVCPGRHIGRLETSQCDPERPRIDEWPWPQPAGPRQHRPLPSRTWATLVLGAAGSGPPKIRPAAPHRAG